MYMETCIKDRLRLVKVDVLSLLHVLSVSDSIALELEEISSSTHTSESDLKGIIGTLRRMKFNEESIIQPSGRDQKGRIRWQINKNVVDKNELAIFLEQEIFGDI